jgi:FixJ family two-component response regulator
VAVVDDDESVRESLPDLLRELGFAARAYASAADFLASADLGRTACLLLDVAMPSMTGPELIRELRRRGEDTPVVFITAHGDEATRPGLVEEGAAECLLKPFSETALLAALKSALGVTEFAPPLRQGGPMG